MKSTDERRSQAFRFQIDAVAAHSVPRFVKRAFRHNRLDVTAAHRVSDRQRLDGVSVTIQSAKDFVADALNRGKPANGEAWKAGLNWFFREGRKHGRPQPPGVPTPGSADTGRAPWESRLIERLRLNHYSWRTEQTMSAILEV